MSDMPEDKLMPCHFTVSELEYLERVMTREHILTHFVQKHLEGLGDLGVSLSQLIRPNITGKLLSYIRKGRDKK